MTVKIDIDYNCCTGCMKCVSSCSYGVLGWLDDAPIVANPYDCNACRECQRNCEVGAIKIKVT